MRTTIALYALMVVMNVPVIAGPPANLRFLPGNACFPVLVGEDSLSEWKASGTIAGRFAPSPRDIGRLGYQVVGAERLEITECSHQLLTSLEESISRLRRKSPRRVAYDVSESKKGTEEPREENRILMFVHRKSFDFERFSPFMQFNENWIEEGMAMHWAAPRPGFGKTNPPPVLTGPPPRAARQTVYGTTYVDDIYRLEERDADLVAPLVEPGTPVSNRGVVRVKGGDHLAFFLITEELLDEHNKDIAQRSTFRRGTEPGDLIRVTSDGLENLETGIHALGWQVERKSDDFEPETPDGN